MAGLETFYSLNSHSGQRDATSSVFALVSLQILESPDPRITDPRRTWISFVHRPDDGNTSKRRCKGKDKKLVGYF